MSKEENIRKGFLSGKMAGFTPEPPEEVWTSINGQLNGGRKSRGLIFFIAVAAGLALALTVGIALLSDGPIEDIAERSVISDNADVVGEAQHIEEESMQADPSAGGKSLDRKTEKPAGPERIRRSSLKEKVIVAMEEEISGNQESGTFFAGQMEDLNPAQSEDTVRSMVSEHEVLSRQEEDSLLNLLIPDEPEEILQEEKTRSGKWQVGASLSPQYSYRDVASSNAARNLDANSSESGKLTYAGGIQVNYKPTGRLSIESGLFYNRMGVNIEEYSNFSDGRMFAAMEVVGEGAGNVISISNSMGTVVAEDKSLFVNNYSAKDAVADYHLLTPRALSYNNSAVDGFSQTFEFIEIPLSLKYTIIDRAFKLQLIGGMSTNLLMNNVLSASTSTGTEQVGEFIDLRTFNYSGNAGIGFIYDFAKNFSLSVEPRFRYYLNSINVSDLPPTRPYTFGLQTGVNYTF